MITAGPAREAIDPVRFIGNHSSGKMGFALARAAIEAGATVTLVAGPVHLDTPARTTRIDVESARDMLNACQNACHQADIFIACAAVADYRRIRQGRDDGRSPHFARILLFHVDGYVR